MTGAHFPFHDVLHADRSQRRLSRGEIRRADQRSQWTRLREPALRALLGARARVRAAPGRELRPRRALHARRLYRIFDRDPVRFRRRRRCSRRGAGVGGRSLGSGDLPPAERAQSAGHGDRHLRRHAHPRGLRPLGLGNAELRDRPSAGLVGRRSDRRRSLPRLPAVRRRRERRHRGPLGCWLRWGRTGLFVRAASHDPSVAAMCGVRTAIIGPMVVGFGAAFAGVAGIVATTSSRSIPRWAARFLSFPSSSR